MTRTGKLEQAQSTYQQVLEIDQRLEYPHLAVETTADLARDVRMPGGTHGLVKAPRAVVPDTYAATRRSRR